MVVSRPPGEGFTLHALRAASQSRCGPTRSSWGLEGTKTRSTAASGSSCQPRLPQGFFHITLRLRIPRQTEPLVWPPPSVANSWCPGWGRNQAASEQLPPRTLLPQCSLQGPSALKTDTVQTTCAAFLLYRSTERLFNPPAASGVLFKGRIRPCD